jgi:hypothetical protein
MAVRLSARCFEANPVSRWSFPVRDYRFDAGLAFFTLDQVEELFRLAGKTQDHFDYYKHCRSVACHYFWEVTQIKAYAELDQFMMRSSQTWNFRWFHSQSTGRICIALRSFVHTFHASLAISWVLGPILVRWKRIWKWKWEFSQPSHEWSEWGTFDHPKLVQLFNHYATYSKPNLIKLQQRSILFPHPDLILAPCFFS